MSSEMGECGASKEIKVCQTCCVEHAWLSCLWWPFANFNVFTDAENAALDERWHVNLNGDACAETRENGNGVQGARVGLGWARGE